ncbi:hypothetical protein [Bradyrhizobium mercantei]|nr:hypothetical protein [Bradyrhizobium mercantei]
MQLIIGIFCGVLLLGFIGFAFRQGFKVTPDSSGNASNGDNMTG